MPSGLGCAGQPCRALVPDGEDQRPLTHGAGKMPANRHAQPKHVFFCEEEVEKKVTHANGSWHFLASLPVSCTHREGRDLGIRECEFQGILSSSQLLRKFLIFLTSVSSSVKWE